MSSFSIGNNSEGKKLLTHYVFLLITLSALTSINSIYLPLLKA